MSDTSQRECPKCKYVMKKQIGCGYFATKGFKPTIADYKQSERTKKVKDKDRAIKSRKRAFGSDSVGNPVDAPNTRHIIKGRALDGQTQEVDKQDLVKALAKDNYAVEVAKKAISKQP